jgi:hypothetical protein
MAADCKAVGNAAVSLHDAPSTEGAKPFGAPRGMPPEVVRTCGLRVKVRAAPQDGVGFSAGKGTVLEATKSIGSGWIKVRHQVGQSGYLKSTDIWGH